jgi:nucleotide-binding universal stress UspA family protein
MKILICSDGMPPADSAIRLGASVARATSAETTLLGIAEKSGDEIPLREAVSAEAEYMRGQGVVPTLVLQSGEPVRQILEQTSKENYDLVIIGSRRTTTSGPYWRTEKTYEVIKLIPSPVLVAIGDRSQLARLLVCTGGKEYIDDAVKLTGKLAAALGASITLLHVMAEPPALYADLVALEEDVDLLLESGSELGRNLTNERKQLEALGVPVTVRVRHGNLVDQVFAEASQGNHDMIVTGSSRARGAFTHYIMGDVTRQILNRADFPVLVARSTNMRSTSFWGRLRNVFAPARPS